MLQSFTRLVSGIMLPIFTGIVFVIVFIPVGLISRLLNMDMLRLRRDRSLATYWIKRTPPGPSPETMRNRS